MSIAKRYPKRKWFIQRDIAPGHPHGDDWVVRAYEDGRLRLEAKWYGTRSQALKDLRRRFNGHAGRIL
ncbi:MAG TPA: hypothetical protein VF783_13870 [Terriglobales bacterium]